MKVGILTHHWLYNFGANLQAMSTVRCLRSLGHDPVIINYRPPQLVEKYGAMTSDDQIAVHQEFLDQHVAESEICSNQQDVIAATQKLGLTAMLSGSDAVLRIDTRTKREDLNFPNPYWLTWAADAGVKRKGFLAASSMGSNFLSIPKNERNEIGRAIADLNCIGLRDKWTMRMLGLCGSQGNEFTYCPDPVSVLPELIGDDQQRPSSDEKYILMSLYNRTLKNETIEQFVKLANDDGYQVYSLPHPELEFDGPFNRVLKLPMTPLEWYNWLAHASGYVGVRFHPIMISIVNDVPFVALDMYQMGIRFKSKWLDLAARPLKLFLRSSSKTFDLCSRAGKTRYCLNRYQQRFCNATKIYSLLREQFPSIGNQSKEFRSTAPKFFTNTIQEICPVDK